MNEFKFKVGDFVSFSRGDRYGEIITCLRQTTEVIDSGVSVTRGWQSVNKNFYGIQSQIHFVEVEESELKKVNSLPKFQVGDEVLIVERNRFDFAEVEKVERFTHIDCGEFYRYSGSGEEVNFYRRPFVELIGEDDERFAFFKKLTSSRAIDLFKLTLYRSDKDHLIFSGVRRIFIDEEFNAESFIDFTGKTISADKEVPRERIGEYLGERSAVMPTTRIFDKKANELCFVGAVKIPLDQSKPIIYLLSSNEDLASFKEFVAGDDNFVILPRKKKESEWEG